jgi:hypothetical protein
MTVHIAVGLLISVQSYRIILRHTEREVHALPSDKKFDVTCTAAKLIPMLLEVLLRDDKLKHPLICLLAKKRDARIGAH